MHDALVRPRSAGRFRLGRDSAAARPHGLARGARGVAGTRASPMPPRNTCSSARESSWAWGHSWGQMESNSVGRVVSAGRATDSRSLK